MGAAGMAVRLHFCFVVGLLGNGTNLLWQLASSLWRRGSGRVAADHTGGGHCSLHHGPVREYAVVFDCGVGLDCSDYAAAKVRARRPLAGIHRADPSFNGRIRVGLRWGAGMDTERKFDHAATICGSTPASGAVPAGHGRISSNPREPSIFLSAALAVV